MSKSLVFSVLQQLLRVGVKELCVCPGGRNAAFVVELSKSTEFETFFWYEERSAAFFALGKTKIHNRPSAVITTSGTAAAELLPAAIEAYFSGNPLILVTADRPRRFRGTGAPQTIEQVGLFGTYATYSQDLEGDEQCDLMHWNQVSPAHINVCFEEPLL
jgi:2-succinyl-5-enolpyruvyl-6-hydroxy-3-cyclohexene-1-carboxylate synthase